MDETGEYFCEIVSIKILLNYGNQILSPSVELDEDLQQHVTDVMEQFEHDTELIFRKFYQKCDQSGYHIEREQFMSLVTER